MGVAWALADPDTREAIHAAHGQPLQFVIAYAERNVFASRSGTDGIVQEDIRGVVAAAFDHWDSRAGDPQLHTHVVVMNRAQTSDGTWRTLDSRALFKEAVGTATPFTGREVGGRRGSGAAAGGVLATHQRDRGHDEGPCRALRDRSQAPAHCA